MPAYGKEYKDMGDIELIMVTGNNNNKFYKMHDRGDGTFDVTFGRVGTSEKVRK